MSPRAARALSLAIPVAVLAIWLGSTLATRIGGLVAAFLLAGVMCFAGNDPLEARSSDPGAQAREFVAQQTLRDIMRRRNAKICAVAGLIFLALVVVGYGPWSS